MNLLDILLVKKFAKVESFIEKESVTKIVEREKLIEEVQKMIGSMKEDNFPIELTFREAESYSTIRSVIIEVIQETLDYIVVEDERNHFTFICEENNNSGVPGKYYIQWDNQGVRCSMLQKRHLLPIKHITKPIHPKESFKEMNADEIHQSMMMFYGRSIEMNDLILFGTTGDKAAIRFLAEISQAFVEMIGELKITGNQELYVSKTFPLFKNNTYLNQIKQKVKEEYAIKIS